MNTSQPMNSSQTKPTRPFKDELFLVSEFNKRWSADAGFRDFARQVYSYLDHMKPNKILRLDRYTGKKLEWIVLTAAAFIAEGVHSMDYFFTDDFTAIHHVDIPSQEIEDMRTHKYGSLIKEEQ